MTGSRGEILFSVLASSGFSLHVRAVREHGLVRGQAAPRSPLDSEKPGASCAADLCPTHPGTGLGQNWLCEARGWGCGYSPASGFFPGILPEDLVEDSLQEDPSPGRRSQSPWLVGHAERPTCLVLYPTLQVQRPSTCGYSCDGVG